MADAERETKEAEARARLERLISTMRGEAASGAPVPPAPPGSIQGRREAVEAELAKARKEAEEARIELERQRANRAEVELQIKEIHEVTRRERRAAELEEERVRAEARATALALRLDELQKTLQGLLQDEIRQRETSQREAAEALRKALWDLSGGVHETLDRLRTGDAEARRTAENAERSLYGLADVVDERVARVLRQGLESRDSLTTRLEAAHKEHSEALARTFRELCELRDHSPRAELVEASVRRLEAAMTAFEALRAESSAGLEAMRRELARSAERADERATAQDQRLAAFLPALGAALQALERGMGERFSEATRSHVALWDSQAAVVRQAAAELRASVEPLSAAIEAQRRETAAVPGAARQAFEEAARRALLESAAPLADSLHRLRVEFEAVKSRLSYAADAMVKGDGEGRAAWERATGHFERLRTELERRDKERDAAYAARLEELRRLVDGAELRRAQYEAAWADRLERSDARLEELKAVLQTLTSRLPP